MIFPAMNSDADYRQVTISPIVRQKTFEFALGGSPSLLFVYTVSIHKEYECFF